MEPIIVTLSPRKDSDNTISVSSFEEAFGEHSDFLGFGKKARAKRKARKLERIANRNEVKTARQTARQQRKAQRQTARQDNKQRRVQAKQTRKDTKSQSELARQQAEYEQEQSQQPVDDGSQGYDDGSGQPIDDGSQGYDDGSGQAYDDGSGQVYDDGSGQAYDDGSGQAYDDGSGQAEDDGSGEYGFDGIEGDDYFINAEGRKEKIHPKLTEITNKLAWQQELLKRMEAHLPNAKTQAEKEHYIQAIANRKKNIAAYEAMLEGYTNASGREKHGRNRRLAIGAAKRFAGKRLAKRAGKNTGVAPLQMLMKKQAVKSRNDGGSENPPIDPELNPVITNNRIEIPAKSVSNFDGTKTVEIDDGRSSDDTVTRRFDLHFSSIEGDTKKKFPYLAVGIGVGVAILAIVLAKKYKVFGK